MKLIDVVNQTVTIDGHVEKYKLTCNLKNMPRSVQYASIDLNKFSNWENVAYIFLFKTSGHM